jgi:hypothetical protein
VRVPTLAISGLPLGNPGTKSHLDVGPMERCSVCYKGEGGGFPQVRAVVSLMCPCCSWHVLAPKVLQSCTNHLVLVLCKSVWVSEACQLFLVPSWSSSMPFYPSEVLRAKERAPTCYSSTVFYWDSHLSPSRSWECINMEGQFHFLALWHTTNLEEVYGITWPHGPHHFRLGVLEDFQRLDLEKAWMTQDLVFSRTWYDWSPWLNPFLLRLVM